MQSDGARGGPRSPPHHLEASMRIHLPAHRYLLITALLLTTTALPAQASAPPTTPTSTPDCTPGVHAAPNATCISYGPESNLGAGTVRTYTAYRSGKTQAVGVMLDRTALQKLPTSRGKHCFDKDNDSHISPTTACTGGTERPLTFAERPRKTGLKWALLNYSPYGHGPQHVYDTPHFDVHFYLQPKAQRDAIRPGPCGVLINCIDYARATAPVPPAYMPADYEDQGRAQVAMGNHLIDPTAPEWHHQGFTHTFIYGAYDGRLTFFEPMVSLAWLNTLARDEKQGGCTPVKQPTRWQRAGMHPEQYCIRYHSKRDAFSISLEQFTRNAM
uniref:DUF5602 domain-containing protein n=1 Tax=Streptomyces sp. WT6 TaxID=1486372 RepID=A0A023PXR1_9ACTN|nr:hypothetical protein wt6.32c [Streptomyces sp. WT6]